MRAAVVELLAHAVEEHGLGAGAVVLLEGVPGLWLRRPDPVEQVGREQGAGAVVGLRVALGVEPAVSGQMGADVGLKVALLVQGHRRSPLQNQIPVKQIPGCRPL